MKGIGCGAVAGVRSRARDEEWGVAGEMENNRKQTKTVARQEKGREEEEKEEKKETREKI